MDALRRSARPTPTTTPPPAPDGFDLLLAGERLGAFPPRGRKNRTADRGKTPVRSTPVRSPPVRSPPRGRLGRPSSRQTAARGFPSAAAAGPRQKRGGRRIESSGARLRRASSPSSPPPSFDGAIVVEGANDRAAVLRAVRPSRGVILLKGAYDARSGHHVVPADVTRDVARLSAGAVDVVVLTDSDVAGRQLRSRLVQDAPLCLHAFIGTHLSSAAEDTEWHRAGNVGVEHAAPEAIRDALAARREAHSAGGSSGISRDEFSRSDLERWGLCGPLGESAPDPRWRAFGGVATRRRLVGERLGVGDCDAKQLTRQLNLFFAREEAEAAVAALPEEGEAAPAKMTDGGADRAAGDFGEEGEGDLDIFAYLAPGEAPPGFR
jgi:5S rRNA maturation endonuclease (ribonuclease M5)